MLINVKIIEDFNSSKELRYLAAFLYFKSLYSNSCVFDYSERSLARKSKLSITAVRKYIKYFKEHNLVRFHGKNLVFIKIKQIGDHYQIRQLSFIDTKGKTIQQITLSLYHELLKKRQRTFDYAKELNHDLTTPGTYMQHKRAKKIAKGWVKAKKLPGESDLLRLSMTTIAKLLNCSKAKAHGIIKGLKKQITVYSQKSLLASGITRKMAKQLITINPGAYYFRGSVFKNECNSYIF